MPKNTISVFKYQNIVYNKNRRCIILKNNLGQTLSQIWNILRLLYTRFREHGIGYTGGQIAYFFILSVFPFLIFINALIASFNIPTQTAISFLEPFFPGQIVSFIAAYIEYINAQSSMSLLSFGIVLAIFSASKSVRSLNRAFNRAYNTEQTRGFFAQIFFSMVFIFLFALIFFASIILVAFGNDFISKIISEITLSFAFVDLLTVWRWVTMALIMFFTMSIIYKFIPSTKVSFRQTLPGTVFSLICFLALCAGFSFYVNNIVSSSVFYGSIGAILLLMLWMYFAGIILVLGAELNKILSDRKND